MRRPVALLLAAAAGCRAADPPPAPAPPRRFAAADGTAWQVRDGRSALAGGERPYPAAVPDTLSRASAAAAGAARPAAAELVVTSYRQTVRDPAYSGPGDYHPLFGQEGVIPNASAHTPAETGFLFGLLGLAELFNVGRHVTLAGVATSQPEPAEEPGATCHLRGTATLTWADGRRTVVPIDARGNAQKGGGEKRWGGAVQAAQDQAAAAVWRQVWQAVRAEPGNAPPPPSPGAQTDPRTAAPLSMADLPPQPPVRATPALQALTRPPLP